MEKCFLGDWSVRTLWVLTFFQVGVGLIVFENWRRGQKESSRREDVADRLNELEESERKARKYYGEALLELEKEILRLRAKNGIAPGENPRILPKSVWDLAEKEDKEEEEKGRGWLSWIPRFTRKAAPGNEVETNATTAVKPDIRTSNDDSPHERSWSSMMSLPRRHARDIAPKTLENSAETKPEEKPTGSKPLQ